MRKSSEINENNGKDEKLNGKCPADTVFVRIDGDGHMFICSLLICLLVISTLYFYFAFSFMRQRKAIRNRYKGH